MIIEVTSVPDLFILEMFMPRLSVAEMFGRNAYSESLELEEDVKAWIKLIISPVLKSYFGEEQVKIQKP